jgi:ferredoxin
VEGDQFVLDEVAPQPPKLALLGVRPCELAAINVQDRVFGLNDHRTFRCESESYYTAVRRQCLLIAVNCTHPGGSCFCSSWGTGPEAKKGYDLVLTELRNGFVVGVGSERGAALIEQLPVRPPTDPEVELAELKLQRAREQMGRQLETKGVRQLLDQSIDHPVWDDVAKRCLSCGNCTMVCPTCFCSSVTDSTDLSGQQITRTRRWESCFTHQFSYLTNGPHRNTISGRYRHWLRHKLGTWWDQFGTSGCVGCGRCITWCPVGIDLTEEIPRIRQHQVPDLTGQPALGKD